MPRVRLGVVLVVPPPVAGRIDGLRAAFGDPALDQVMPHVTLVPPVNVQERDVPAALAVLRAAAAQARTLTLRLGPIRVFPGFEHVAFLAVDGEPGELDRVRRLRAAVFRPPLERALDHDFVPHVTVAQGIDSARLAAVLEATTGLEPVAVVFDRIHLLQEHHRESGRRWQPIADVALAPPVIVGRGGLPVELTPSEAVDPEALSVWPDGVDADTEVPDEARRLVVTARREGAVVGLAWGWTAGPHGELVDGWCRETDPDLDRQIEAAWSSAAADRGVLA
jgi:2'-5' RNA ligase